MSQIGERVQMSHGSGGKAMAELIDELFLSAFDNQWLNEKNDQALLLRPAGRIVMTTDSYVVTPLFFSGGDIGSMAVHGTINDIAMGGGQPLALSAGFILEEGFPIADLKRIIKSMAHAAQEAEVPIVTGDTKVVQKGKGDGVFINTTGIGVVADHIHLSTTRVQPGDKIIINGYVGDHGTVIMSTRANLGFETKVQSDSQALHGLVKAMLEVVPNIHCMRDPTRGGVAATLNEVAHSAKVDMKIYESRFPIREEVQSACELLGLDPLYVANEGKLLAFCPPEKADELVKAMKTHPQGKNSVIVGEVLPGTESFVEMETYFGGLRLVHWLSGEQLPRIC